MRIYHKFFIFFKNTSIVKENIIRIINALREEKILADAKDLIAFIKSNGRANTSLSILSEYAQIEKLIIDVISEEEKKINLSII